MTQQANSNAEFCGRVPLHQTNLIQPHGVLLVIDKRDFSIVQASENAEGVFDKPVKELLQSNLLSYLGNNDKLNFQNLFTSAAEGKLPFVFHFKTGVYLSVVHRQQDFFIVELEKEKRVADLNHSFISIYQKLKYIMAAIEAAETTEATARVVVNELKRLSGFDKVMVYQFDEAWNGDVIAEAAEPGMELYMGLKFPASDIPKQARDLYKKTAYRLIPTIDYEPVRLYPVINPVTNVFTDLSDSNLRSVAGVHLEYLRNMKVNASMSTRILYNGELWGLIACHHRTPMYLSYEMCSVFELLSGVITAKIGAVQSRDQLAYATSKQQLQTRFTESIYAGSKPDVYMAYLLQLLEADGMAMATSKSIVTAGQTPSTAEIEDLVIWLQSKLIEDIYQETSLASMYEPAGSYAEACSGLLAIPIVPERGEFLLAFRGEAVQKIAWSGNPQDALQFESDGKKYHPRASFKIWQQTVAHTSLPWGTEVLQTAVTIRQILTARQSGSV